MRVLVGCPTNALKKYCLTEYTDAVKKITYPEKDTLLVDNSEGEEYVNEIKQKGLQAIKGKIIPCVKTKIAESRNVLRAITLEGGYDYFLSLEQDVIPPPDIIERMLAHKKDIITGVYCTYYEINGQMKLMPLIWQKENENSMRFMIQELKDALDGKPALHKVFACGLGCVMISRKALEKIKFKVPKEKNTYDDIEFCKDAEAQGFEIFVDTGIICDHLAKIEKE